LPIEQGGTTEHGAANDEPSRGDRRPTLKTIAQLTGLGITTVSRALKNGPELSVATRARVREIADQLGYRPHRAGVRLRTGRTYVIGLILDQNNTVAEFEKRIILGVSRVLAHTNYHLVVMPLMQDADLMEPIRYFVETAAADGLIFTHTQPRDERVRYLLDRDFPFICHGRTKLDEPHPFYDFDNERFTVEAVHRLSERGRKRLLLIAPLPNLTCSGHMREGFRRAIADAGVHGEILARVHLDSDPAEFRLEAKRLALRPNAPDGVVCANETRSLALVAGLQDGGLTVGQDIDVIGKDTSDLLDHVTPSIDSFYEDLLFAGEELARLLLMRIAGATVDKLQTIAEPRFHRRT
jgi:LacI family transcriptional regulator